MHDCPAGFGGLRALRGSAVNVHIRVWKIASPSTAAPDGQTQLFHQARHFRRVGGPCSDRKRFRRLNRGGRWPIIGIWRRLRQHCALSRDNTPPSAVSYFPARRELRCDRRKCSSGYHRGGAYPRIFNVFTGHGVSYTPMCLAPNFLIRDRVARRRTAKINATSSRRPMSAHQHRSCGGLHEASFRRPRSRQPSDHQESCATCSI